MTAKSATGRQEMGAFLKQRRAQLTPAQFGLPAGSRRRTPGLRREELAQLAGISATWYCWIEQGREVSVSPAALARLAETLHLSRAERAYLFELSGKRDPAEPAAQAPSDLPAALAPAIAAIAVPAYVLDRLGTARLWNRPAARLFAGWLDADQDRNLLRFLFTAPAARRLIQDWADRARRVVAEFRADNGRHLDDPGVRGLVEDLSRRSAVFAVCWGEQRVIGREGGERRFNHPRDGALVYRQIGFAVANQPDLKLVMLIEAPPRNRTRR
jgi:transcriptional regulator with XRE-family HTH domain